MPIERIPTDTVPAHVATGSPTPVQTGINSDTDTSAAIFADALGAVHVLVRQGTAEPIWYRADTMAAAADFFGRLMATDAFTAPDVLAQRVTEDETVCPVCWGIVAPEGVTLVPDDGTPCTCNVPVLESAGPRTVADLDGTVDAADWLTVGHTLDASEVEYLRGLILPDSVPATPRAGVVAALADVLDDRDAHAAAELVRSTDPDDDIWNNYVGPMLDELETDYTVLAAELATDTTPEA